MSLTSAVRRSIQAQSAANKQQRALAEYSAVVAKEGEEAREEDIVETSKHLVADPRDIKT